MIYSPPRKSLHPRRNSMGKVEYSPLELGARLTAGRLSLEQLVMVRIHCPQLFMVVNHRVAPTMGAAFLIIESLY